MLKNIFGIIIFLSLIGAGCQTGVRPDNSGSLSSNENISSNSSSEDLAGDLSGVEGADERETPPTSVEQKIISIDISGKNFSFTPNTIIVNKGDRVVINFSSTDGTHDWTLDEFGAKSKIVNAGEKTSISFLADKIGEFEYYCSVNQHRAMGMIGKFVVRDDSDTDDFVK